MTDITSDMRVKIGDRTLQIVAGPAELMRQVPAGLRKTLVTFEGRSGTADATYGTQSYEWADVAQEWAEVRDILPSRAENVAEGISLQRRPCRLRTQWLEMVCEELSTEGDAP